ncbi:hypothetical protein EON79_13405 [bacterium]|nr:MAG: hypothetical protein EON79_13405 [bacterium]
MERIPLKTLSLLAIVAAGVLAGCNGNEAAISADEEKMFKNPAPVDRSKIPANPNTHKGPAFIGEPSAGSGGGGKPAASGG